MADASPSGGDAGEFVTWQSDIAAFEAVDRLDPPPPGSVLFTGSSSIRLWHTLAADFPRHHVLNRGFGGSRIVDLVYFAQRLVAPYRPGAIVMYAGGNDLDAGESPERVRDAFARFVDKVRGWAPRAPFAYLLIKPNLSRREQLPQIRRANALIAECARAREVAVLDVHTPMLAGDGSGQADPCWFVSDGLHLNEDGYALWTGIVRDWLARQAIA